MAALLARIREFIPLEDHITEVDEVRYENDYLRALLARCVDHIDPNDSDDAFRLLVECEEASRG